MDVPPTSGRAAGGSTTGRAGGSTTGRAAGGSAAPGGAPTTAWDVAATTPDPELPMVTIGDLGILRSVEREGDTVVAAITPTYSGCPALPEIAHDLRRRLQHAGFTDVTVRTVLDPPWTTDWITADGRRKLAAAGIAPPHPAPPRTGAIPLQLLPTRPPVPCPQCGSTHTTRTADFAATACRALYRCGDCREPFEYVKEL